MQFEAIPDGAGGTNDIAVTLQLLSSSGSNYVDNFRLQTKSNIATFINQWRDIRKSSQALMYIRNNVDGIVGFFAHEVQEFDHRL